MTVDAVARPRAVEGGVVRPVAAGQGGGLRAAMPLTAAIVDDLRAELGAEAVDRILRQTTAGRPRFYAAELGADGELREWGRRPSGGRARVTGGKVVL